MNQQASDTLCLILFYRIITDGPMSATVFNGPTPLYDALYTSASNFITGTVTGLMVDSPSVPDTVNHISTTTCTCCDKAIHTMCLPCGADHQKNSGSLIETCLQIDKINFDENAEFFKITYFLDME